MRVFAFATVLALAGGDRPSGPPPSPRGTFAVRCGTLHVGDGGVARNVWLVVEKGKIARIDAKQPAGLPVLDARDKVVVPGLVVADTDLSGTREGVYNVTPHFVGADNFDFSRPLPRCLAGGVTTVYLPAGRKRLIPGQGSVVKLHGEDVLGRIVKERACLQITLGDESTQAQPVFEPTPAPTSDDPLLPARRQIPTARISQLAELRRIFREALAAPPGAELGQGAEEDRYEAGPLVEAARGALPLRVRAHRAADLRRALYLGREFGGGLVLEGCEEIARVARQVAAAGAMAVLRVPVRPGASNPGGEDRKDKRPRLDPAAPAIAARAGVRIALAPPSDDYMADMLMVAGIAVRHGLDPEAALRAITSDAAKALGVDDRVGSLAPGKDADFLVLSGAPFALGTVIEKTYVNGEPAWERQPARRRIAVRAGLAYTMAGPPLRDVVILIEGTKIRWIGTGISIPHGARVVDASDGVVVPGFIDGYSHLGLSGEGSGVPTGAPDQDVAAVIAVDDPLLREAAAAGLSTVLVSGRDGNGPVSGRVAAIKTRAVDRDELVLSSMAAIRMVHDALPPEGIKRLASVIERAKKYRDAWRKYEKALADWKAGKGKKPETVATPAEPAKQDDPITGTWEVDVDLPIPVALQVVARLRLSGTTISGEIFVRVQNREQGPLPISEGRLAGKNVTLSFSTPMGPVTLEGELGDQDRMSGTFRSPQFEGSFEARRVAKSPTAPRDSGTKTEDGRPRKPAVDESLEPLRALLEGKIPAVVVSNRAPAIRDVIAYFAKEKLPLVLAGLRDAVETPSLLAEAEPRVLLGPAVVERRHGKIRNSAVRLSDAGCKIAFGTGDTAGSRYLPLHAAMAVRYGLDPQIALAALTIEAARTFRIDERVGSLERGKDADLVVLDGSPFELTSRVRMVIVNGHVAYEAKEGTR